MTCRSWRQAAGLAHRRQQSCSSRFKVQGSKPSGLSRLPTEAAKPPFQVPGYVHPGHDFRRDSAKLMQASLALAAPNYVLLDHDFCRDSAKLMQASLALAAPKIQSSNLQAGVTSMKAYHTSQLSTLSSQLSSCPQIFTDFKDFSLTCRQLSILRKPAG